MSAQFFHRIRVRGCFLVFFFKSFIPRESRARDRFFHATSQYGSKKTGPYRTKFIRESVMELQQNLVAAGSDLLIHNGKPEDLVSKLLHPSGLTLVLSQEEVVVRPRYEKKERGEK